MEKIGRTKGVIQCASYHSYRSYQSHRNIIYIYIYIYMRCPIKPICSIPTVFRTLRASTHAREERCEKHKLPTDIKRDGGTCTK